MSRISLRRTSRTWFCGPDPARFAIVNKGDPGGSTPGMSPGASAPWGSPEGVTRELILSLVTIAIAGRIVPERVDEDERIEKPVASRFDRVVSHRDWSRNCASSDRTRGWYCRLPARRRRTANRQTMSLGSTRPRHRGCCAAHPVRSRSVSFSGSRRCALARAREGNGSGHQTDTFTRALFLPQEPCVKRRRVVTPPPSRAICRPAELAGESRSRP